MTEKIEETLSAASSSYLRFGGKGSNISPRRRSTSSEGGKIKKIFVRSQKYMYKVVKERRKGGKCKFRNFHRRVNSANDQQRGPGDL